MNNFDSFRPVTRRHFWDDYRSPLTCVDVPTSSGSASGQTIDVNIQPVEQKAGPVLEAPTIVGATIRLDWSEVDKAYAYVVYRSTSPAGPFSIVISGIVGRFFVDSPGIPGTFYYRVTAIEPSFGETAVSNVVSATV